MFHLMEVDIKKRENMGHTIGPTSLSIPLCLLPHLGHADLDSSFDRHQKWLWIGNRNMTFLLLHHPPPPPLTFRTTTTPPAAYRLAAITASLNKQSTECSKWVSGFRSKALNFTLSGALSLVFSLSGIVGFAEGKVGVNKPELLPKEFTTVIDAAGFLSDGQEKRLVKEISSLEKDTGYKLRVLAQNYPNTPGLAIKDYWKVDDRTVVFVADPTFGNLLNFNVGFTVDLDVPRNFWSRVAGKYGNMFYWKEKGEDASIEEAVMAISTCLRDSSNCSIDIN